ncbi:MAG: uroporphyrinogen-III C-methyltransferase [Bacteroidia bacterium]|nr:uroporphyrinogen-III C-methyltransferase [Bacteroidia bacterium]
MAGTLTLVGAGPGDPELITLKGINALRSADVVLYDALVNPQILSHAPETAVIRYVGKRAGNHSFPQEEINRMIVDYASTGAHVVRLKGGDPFVFGRGYEEVLAAQENQIAVNIVPGLSSSVAVPGSLGIPLTHRGVADSFWVLTGQTREDVFSRDLERAAGSSATVVILMGLAKLEQIATLFIQHGKADMPAMVIQSGSLPEEKRAVGTVQTLAQKAEKEGISSPALIVIGNVVRFYQAFPESIYQPNN